MSIITTNFTMIITAYFIQLLFSKPSVHVWYEAHFFRCISVCEPNNFAKVTVLFSFYR